MPEGEPQICADSHRLFSEGRVYLQNLYYSVLIGGSPRASAFSMNRRFAQIRADYFQKDAFAFRICITLC